MLWENYNGRRPLLFVSLGAILGIVMLHPATMAIYWLEFRSELTNTWTHAGYFILERMAASFTPSMLPMTALFATLGALFGIMFAALDAKNRRSERVISHLEQEMARDVPTLIQLGENERVEFKSTVRWDIKQAKVNKALPTVIAKTIAALANHEGGSLLIGVQDDGSVVGLEHDYRTLKSADRDGFSQLLMTLVRERMGGHICRFVHILFLELEGHDICRVIVEPADEPVYVLSNGQSRFFVRTGNASRELDAREIVHYVNTRWAGAGSSAQ